MATNAYCSICERTVYIEVDEDMFCPVCSSPIIEVAEDPAEIATT